MKKKNTKNQDPDSVVFLQKDEQWILMTSIMKGLERSVDPDLKQVSIEEFDFKARDTYKLPTWYFFNLN